ncbi:MAG: protein phosphatase 2C domain-containing protein [Alphaproteobacteria bacterium]
MNWEAAKADHIGGRQEQQDRAEILAARDGTDTLIVVADGMGGHAGGALASEAVVQAARKVWHRHTLQAMSPADLLAAAIKEAHDGINAAGKGKNISPRSTCALLYLNGKQAHWAFVGDSRLYRFRAGELLERTRDHSVVQMLVDLGKIREDQMGKHPDQNRLTQSLGGEAAPEPEFGSAEARTEDGFILCTDGLWETVTTAEMGQALRAHSLGKAAKALVAAAAERGGKTGDNVTVTLARYGTATVAPPLPPPPARGRLRIFFVAVVALITALLAVWLLFPKKPNQPEVTLPIQLQQPATPPADTRPPAPPIMPQDARPVPDAAQPTQPAPMQPAPTQPSPEKSDTAPPGTQPGTQPGTPPATPPGTTPPPADPAQPQPQRQ